jgi:hypothetical protein
MTNVIQFGLSPSMDDNVFVFATTIVYSTTCTNKYRSHKANFVISIELLSFQCSHPWVLFAIIHGFSHDIIFNN